MLCVRAALTNRRTVGANSDTSRPWWWLAALAAAFGINKELDLQTFLIDVARISAKSEGWYDHRRIVQEAFVGVTVVVVSVLGWRLANSHRSFIRNHGAVAAGLVLVVLYCVLRAAGIDHIKIMVGRDPAENVPLWLIEVLGVALMVLGAALAGDCALSACDKSLF